MGMTNFSSGTNNANGNGGNGSNGGYGNPFNMSNPYGGDSDPTDDMLADMLIDYNALFQNAGPTMYRDAIVRQTLSVLIGKNKPNALLIGPAGVGKTKIVEDIAWRLASNDPLIPDTLKGFHVYELPLSNIVAGSSMLGQFEEKIRAVIDFAEDPDQKAIIFIDEIHQLVEGHGTYSKIAQILKPALARGNMRVVGATTTQEAGDLADDPAFNRRFSRIIVDELTRDQTLDIMKQMRPAFFAHYGNKIAIDDKTLETVAIMADNYHTPGAHRPDTALTLLDRAIGDAIIARKAQELAAQGNPTVLGAIRAVPIIPITEKQIKTTALRLMTGNSKKESLDIDSLRDRLSTIQGQDNVVEKIVTMLRRDDMNLFPRTKPLTVLFVGPSGVGKTEVTKIIAKEMTGKNPIVLNMTEFNSPASINRIIGSPAGYIGSDSHAELPFDCLESNPYQIILLDEFEKGDRSVQRLFMSAFDEGYIKTNKGKTIDFSKSIIIATTNASHKDTTAKMGFMNETQASAASVVTDLSKWFDTELLNRFSSIMTFNEISKDIYRNIIVAKYHAELERIRVDHPKINLPDDIPEDDLDAMVETTYIPAFGARPAGKSVQEYIETHALP